MSAVPVIDCPRLDKKKLPPTEDALNRSALFNFFEVGIPNLRSGKSFETTLPGIETFLVHGLFDRDDGIKKHATSLFVAALKHENQELYARLPAILGNLLCSRASYSIALHGFPVEAERALVSFAESCENWALKLRAIQVLSVFPGQSAQPLFARILNEPDSAVPSEAKKAAMQGIDVRNEKITPELCKFLELKGHGNLELQLQLLEKIRSAKKFEGTLCENKPLSPEIYRSLARVVVDPEHYTHLRFISAVRLNDVSDSGALSILRKTLTLETVSKMLQAGEHSEQRWIALTAIAAPVWSRHSTGKTLLLELLGHELDNPKQVVDVGLRFAVLQGLRGAKDEPGINLRLRVIRETRDKNLKMAAFLSLAGIAPIDGLPYPRSSFGKILLGLEKAIGEARGKDALLNMLTASAGFNPPDQLLDWQDGIVQSLGKLAGPDLARQRAQLLSWFSDQFKPDGFSEPTDASGTMSNVLRALGPLHSAQEKALLASIIDPAAASARSPYVDDRTSIDFLGVLRGIRDSLGMKSFERIELDERDYLRALSCLGRAGGVYAQRVLWSVLEKDHMSPNARLLALKYAEINEHGAELLNRLLTEGKLSTKLREHIVQRLAARASTGEQAA